MRSILFTQILKRLLNVKKLSIICLKLSLLDVQKDNINTKVSIFVSSGLCSRACVYVQAYTYVCSSVIGVRILMIILTDFVSVYLRACVHARMYM